MMQGTTQSINDSGLELSESEVQPQPSRTLRLRRSNADPEVLDRFRRACGQRARIKVRISSSEGGGASKPLQWDRPSLVVGSGEDCDLQLAHAEISRRHAYFQLIGGRLYCADLESSTGTHWSNGASQAGWVEAGEPVSIGPYSMAFDLDSIRDPPESQTPEAPKKQSPSASADTEEIPIEADMFLDFVNAGRQVRRYRVSRDVTLIGSGNGVKIHLTHPSVANAHCSVVRTATGLWVLDLLTPDGTIINGKVEPLAALQPGDEFQVGRFLVAVHYGLPDEARESSLQIRSDNGRPLPAASHPEMHQLPSHASGEDGQLSREPESPNQLAPLDSTRTPFEIGRTTIEGGLSEQFVLNIIRELGVMQQQALRYAQDSLKDTLGQLASAYEQRIDALERQHAALRNQLSDLDPSTNVEKRPRLESPSVDNQAATLCTPSQDDADVSDLPHQEPRPNPQTRDHTQAPEPDQQDPRPPEQFSFPTRDIDDPVDPQEYEQWVRDQIKTIELELEKTKHGWGKKLVELLGG